LYVNLTPETFHLNDKAVDSIDYTLPPEKISKQLKVGEFTKARIISTDGHDLVALPI
jgi:ribosomal protein S12 methylthiotransferase